MTGRIVPVLVYVRVAMALLALLGLTITISFIDLGDVNLVIALTIAIVKATLVVLFFMHMRHSPRVNWIVGIAGITWLFFMLILSMSDFMTRPNL